MSDRERVLQRLEAAMANLEAAAERRLSSVPVALDSGDAGGAEALRQQLDAVVKERDTLAISVDEQSKRNADLGTRLDQAIAKLNKVLEQA